MLAQHARHPIARHPHVLINTFIDRGSIELVSLLGVGAYGVVYLGYHSRSKQYYAVKLIINAKAIDNEIRMHSRVTGHRNILTLEKVVVEGGNTYMILEYATGGDLFSAITRKSSNIIGNTEAIRHIFLQILDAVQHCHQRGVAHRDLKPENILLFPDLHVKLADFGLATSQPVSAEFGCGSTFYFSPECQGGLIRDHQRIKGYGTQQNDIWSLGIILINLTAGRNPWKQATMQDPTFAEYARQPRRFFRTILPHLSKDLDYILSRVFCLDPARRISLPELRLRILECSSFLRHEQRTLTVTNSLITKATLPSMITTTRMQYNESLAQTMAAYVGGFIDDNDSFMHCSPMPKKHVACLAPMPMAPSSPPSCSETSYSSTSSIASMECPPTPPMASSSPFDSKKIRQLTGVDAPPHPSLTDMIY
ncbi:kinase-like domain-containing protein [Radiomyces spectabilis]|uniref:kinase-like domain-containing protein n=1 Tax=Radiomyces spectabilis TaxID=64574 RepID=UPI00221F8981|nr:kinase-like domain-containing protein [Radiomyces spectabilis]KAI8370383.1 kinase-like domain-containing protein [Radiomyces spectabilis]